MGLREAKKRKVRASIIENSIALFRRQGFEATTVREISTVCELSEATFFNYFPTKDAVLNAWAHDLVEGHFRAGLGPGERRLRPFLRTLCDGLAAAVEADREFAARAWTRARLPSNCPAPGIHLVETAQERGELRRDLSAPELGGISYVAIFGSLAAWLLREEPRGPLASELRRATDLVLDGSRRRNERVRPSGRAAPPPA